VKEGKFLKSEPKDFLLSVIGSSPYGIIALDYQGKIIMVNSLAMQYLGIEDEINSIADRSVYGYIQFLPELESILRSSLEKQQKSFDLELIPYNDNFFSFRGRLTHHGMIITIEDVTRLKEMETAVLNSMIEGQELERRRLAKEMHDGVGPLLSTIKMNIQKIESDIVELSPPIKEDFSAAYSLIDTVADEIRYISHHLLPKVIEDFGLSAGLESLCKRLDNTSKLEVYFYSSHPEERFDQMIELGLYRSGQELINNAVKHSDAKRIEVQLIKHADSLVLSIEDDGKGFDWKMLPGSGIGLANVETRVASLGGTCSIDTRIGQGVNVVMEIPLNSEKYE